MRSLVGKDPLYVADDIKDIERRSCGHCRRMHFTTMDKAVAQSKEFMFTKKCTITTIEEFVKEVKSWKIGAPVPMKSTYIGPLKPEGSVESVLERQVSDALNKGAQCISRR